MSEKIKYALTMTMLMLAAGFVNSQPCPVPGPQPDQQPGPRPAEVPQEEISLADAVARAIACNPALAAAESKVKAAAARVQQAGLFANPELEMEYENFGGQDELHGFDGADATIAIAQPIQLGGSRVRRRDVADAEAQLASGDLDLQRREVEYRTKTAFFELLAAQQEQVLAAELHELSEGFARTVQARVDAGKVSPVESTRARIETARAEVALSNARYHLSQAKVRLAASWGSSDVDFERSIGPLPQPQILNPYADLQERLNATPEAQLMQRNLILHERSVKLEKALAVPDLRVQVGSRHFRASGLSAWVAGLSIPIPIFDRNQGARRAAEFELEAARRTSESVSIEQQARLRSLVDRLLATENALTSMEQIVEPAAAEAFAAVNIGYREGKFAFIDLLQAQQALFEARRLNLESRLAYALALCELERLVGPISQPNEATPSAAKEQS